MGTGTLPVYLRPFGGQCHGVATESWLSSRMTGSSCPPQRAASCCGGAGLRQRATSCRLGCSQLCLTPFVSSQEPSRIALRLLACLGWHCFSPELGAAGGVCLEAPNPSSHPGGCRESRPWAQRLRAPFCCVWHLAPRTFISAERRHGWPSVSPLHPPSYPLPVPAQTPASRVSCRDVLANDMHATK